MPKFLTSDLLVNDVGEIDHQTPFTSEVLLRCSCQTGRPALVPWMGGSLSLLSVSNSDDSKMDGQFLVEYVHQYLWSWCDLAKAQAVQLLTDLSRKNSKLPDQVGALVVGQIANMRMLL